MVQNSSPGDASRASGQDPPAEELRRRLADTQARLALAEQARERLERVLADERVQLDRSFELFERDRRLLGFELHDGIVQDLTAALMFLESGLAELVRNGGSTPESLATCERIIGKCIGEARRLMNGLQPPLWSEQGLRAALESLCEDTRERGIPSVVLHFDAAIGTLSPPLEIAVYRVVQESLNNVWQHSGAQRVVAAIQISDGQLEITVSDDGAGFAADRLRSGCYGLIGIRERAAMFGGQATIESSPGAGTTVRARLRLA